MLRKVQLFALFAICASCVTMLSAPTITVVSTTGGMAPGTSGGVFSTLGKPSINTGGHIAFRADIGNSSVTKGVFLVSGSSISAVALSGNGGSNGAWYFTDFGDPSINNSDQVAFVANLGIGLQNFGIFLASPSSISPIVLTGSPAPGTLGNFRTLGRPGLVLIDSGVIVFQAAFDGPKPGDGIFKYSNGTISSIAIMSQSAAGTAGGEFARFLQFSVNNAGEVAFAASLTGGAAASGVFVTNTAGTRAIALQGQVAPYGINSTFGPLRSPSINEAGDVTFVDNVWLRKARVPLLTSVGIASSASLGKSPVALKGARLSGDPTLLSGNLFAPTNARLADGSNATLFGAWNDVPGRTALFLRTARGLQQLLQKGDAAPGGGTYSLIAFPVLSVSGQFAFISTLSDASHNSALFTGKAF